MALAAGQSPVLMATPTSARLVQQFSCAFGLLSAASVVRRWKRTTYVHVLLERPMVVVGELVGESRRVDHAGPRQHIEALRTASMRGCCAERLLLWKASVLDSPAPLGLHGSREELRPDGLQLPFTPRAALP